MYSIRTQAVLTYLLSLYLCACSVIGTGKRTIIRATCPSSANESCQTYLAVHYPNLVYSGAESEARRVLLINPNGAPAHDSSEPVRKAALDEFRQYLTGKYGRWDFEAAQIGFNVHDRGSSPALSPYDVSQLTATGLTALITSNPNLAADEITRLQKSLQAHLHNVADVPQATVLHSTVDGRRVYYYYPRLSLDFSAQFPSTSTYDRLSYLALVVRLKEPSTGQPPRFLDFAPKLADLPQVSRGNFTETTQAQVSYGAGGSMKMGGGMSGGSSSGMSASAGPSASLSNSDSYTDTLLDSVERKTMGILDNGQTFFADLRSLREVRIAGTYNFDLMLEMPAVSQPSQTGDADISQPAKEIKADVFLVGVVRHVYRRGMKGVWTRVPETENDHVYEQVLLKVLPDQTLWQFPGEPYVDPRHLCVVKVVTNRTDAIFVLKRNADEEPVISGAGTEATLEIKPTNKRCQAEVRFLTVLAAASKPKDSGQSEAQLLRLDAPCQRIDQPFTESVPILVTGNYLPTKSEPKADCQNASHGQ